ncbi:hypothetical protein MYX82_00310 [Acidobacteria bacterium AH-259-D05]|nr:hypothetical protein [Acidobacteria bacterium AH-259-D05]
MRLWKICGSSIGNGTRWSTVCPNDSMQAIDPVPALDMNKKSTTLYVSLQRDVDIRMLSHELEAQGIGQWLYLGEDNAWRLQAESALSSGACRISVADSLDEMSWRLRQPYIDCIGELSQLNDSLEWWACELAAKTVYSKLYVRICLLAVARRLIDVGFNCPTFIVCSTPALLDEVVGFASEKGTSLRPLATATSISSVDRIGKAGRRYLGSAYRRLRKLAGRLFGGGPSCWESNPSYRRKLLAKKGVTASVDFTGEDTILFFTWVDHRNFGDDGGYRDPHLGLLPEMLRERGYRVAYVPRVLHMIRFDEAVDRLLRTGEQLFFPELYISDQDRENCSRRARRFEPKVTVGLTMCNVPVHRLVSEHLDESRGTLAETLAYECLIANLEAAGVHPKRIIYTFEGQSWEQVLAWSVRRYMPNTKVVGYENLNFSRMALSMYPACCEYGLRPLPDRIVTNGPLYRKILLAENIPPSLVKVGCGLRHGWLWDAKIGPRSCEDNGPNRVIRILVATAVPFSASVEMVSKAVQAFGGDSSYEVIVKCHPMVDHRQVMRHLGVLVQQDNVHFVKTPLPGLLPSVHILLYAYSVVCYESLHYGVPPVFVKSECFLNLDQLEATPNIHWEATTPEDLRRVAGQITQMTSGERSNWERRASEAVPLALAPITPQCVDAFLI